MVNLEFYQLLCNRQPRLIANVHPNAKGRAQTFDVWLTPADPMPLGEPTDLKDALDRVGQNGHLCPIIHTPVDCLPPVLAHHMSHVLSIVTIVLSVGLFILVGLFLLHHFKL